MRKRLDELQDAPLKRALATGGLGIQTGPFSVAIKSLEPAVADGLRLLYPAHPVVLNPPYADFRVELARARGARRWLRPQVTFLMDGVEPFKPLPADQAFPMLEWGLNWCIASLGHRWLLLHSAVLARDRDVVLLPASSGSGKSTLCAALALSGWRLLSDELAMIEPESGLVCPLVRPIGLKNESIGVIRRTFPTAVMSEPVFDTRKGTVAHVGPTDGAVDAMGVPGTVRWIVFPKWQAGATSTFEALGPADVLLGLIRNAFNYDIQGEQGFRVATQIASAAKGFNYTYSTLDDALAAFGALP